MGCNKSVRKVPELTNELWAEVLSYLEYYDLNRCKRVSTQLKAITQLDRFDIVLWRSKPAFPVILSAGDDNHESEEESNTEEDISPERGPEAGKDEHKHEKQRSREDDSLEEGECSRSEGSNSDEDYGSEISIQEGTYPDPANISLHPAFDLVASMTLQDGIEDMLNVWVLTKRDGGGVGDIYPLILCSAGGARATEPAVTEVYVDLQDVCKGGCILVKNNKGVTVMDIMEKICVFSAKRGHLIQSKKLSFLGVSPFEDLYNGVLFLETFWTGLY